MSKKHNPGYWKSFTKKKGTLHTDHIEKFEILFSVIHQFLWDNKGYVSNTDFVNFLNRVEDEFNEFKKCNRSK